MEIFSEKILSRGMPRAEGIELGLEFLGEGGAAGVADADVGGGPVTGNRAGRGRAGPPWLAGAAVGRRLHAQQLGQSRHPGEAAGVVGADDGTGPGPARRSGLDAAAGAGVALDLVGVADGLAGDVITGGLAGLGTVGHPRSSHKHFSEEAVSGTRHEIPPRPGGTHPVNAPGPGPSSSRSPTTSRHARIAARRRSSPRVSPTDGTTRTAPQPGARSPPCSARSATRTSPPLPR